MEQKAISVSQLSGYIKGIFDAEELLHNISVYGEISGLNILRGNAYFTLKDDCAILSCVFFGADESNFNLKNGDSIVATGTPKYYVKGGKLNFNVVKVEPYGVGELYRKFIETKDKLEREGLFDGEHKKPLPITVKKIGVVSSDKGAVIRDIINVTTRRDKSVDIVLFPSRVQGEGADIDVIRGVRYFNYTDVDVIIIARGGGSFEDLMPFNSEALAREVFQSEKPIVSAVGHETDYTIVDFVADLRAPTPSAAAELIVKESKTKVENICQTWQKIANLVLQKINVNLGELVNLKRELNLNIKQLINGFEYDLGLKSQALEKLNPNKLLKMGYAKLESENKNISSVDQISLDQNLHIYLKDGRIKACVKEKQKWN
ncbi:MAG: exodeoxyribonuclease VII large subunit [Christensenellales bacterium]